MASTVRVGIISIGEMGLGVAKLLSAHQYPVATCLANRSSATRQRAESAKIVACEDYTTFVNESDVILSIVPPRDALETASIISRTFKELNVHRQPLHYFDLNALSPSTAVKIGQALQNEGASSAGEIVYYDGGIIGGPPNWKDGSWTKPSIVTSGPCSLFSTAAPSWGPQLCSILNMKHISDTIGKASGLKMCFASLTKGFTSIAIQSYTTAYRLGVLDELQQHLDTFVPSSKKSAERGLVSMPSKAYRWVNEMEEISNTFAQEGGFENSRMFDAVAEIYRSVAEDTVLGDNTSTEQKALDPEEVASRISKGLPNN